MRNKRKSATIEAFGWRDESRRGGGRSAIRGDAAVFRAAPAVGSLRVFFRWSHAGDPSATFPSTLLRRTKLLTTSTFANQFANQLHAQGGTERHRT